MTNEALCAEIQAGNDPQTNLAKLFEQNRRFLFAVANRNTWAGEREDILQELYIALHNAALNFDPAQGVKFLTYAEYHFKAAIFSLADQTGGALHLPPAQRRRILALRRTIAALSKEYGEAPSREQIMERTGLQPGDLEQLLQYIRYNRPLSLDIPINPEDPDSATLGDQTPAADDLEADTVSQVSRQAGSTLLWDTVDTLPEKQRAVVLDLYREDLSTAATAKREDLTPREVQNTRNNALRQLRQGKSYAACKAAAELLELDFTSHIAYEGSNTTFRRHGASSVERIVMKRLKREQEQA